MLSVVAVFSWATATAAPEQLPPTKWIGIRVACSSSGDGGQDSTAPPGLRAAAGAGASRRRGYIEGEEEEEGGKEGRDRHAPKLSSVSVQFFKDVLYQIKFANGPLWQIRRAMVFWWLRL